MSEPRYPCVVVDVSPNEADEAGALLAELGAVGVEHRDATTLARGAADKATLIGSFERHEDALAALSSLPSGWSARFDEVVGDAWRDEWKRFFEPFTLCPGVTVCPPWRPAEQAAGQHVIELEPGRAFGTGLHETTSLVAESLADMQLEGSAVLDIGCGSGILALVALRLGARHARAVDVDPDAVAVTRENAVRNGLEGRLETDTTPVGDLTESFPVVLANIESRTLADMASQIVPRVAKGGVLVLSGILAADVAPAQLPEIRAAFAALREREVRRKGEWIAVVLHN